MSSSSSGRVKNRAPAAIQVSAEQLLRESAERQERPALDPVTKVHDAEEYRAHLRDRRSVFEDNIRYRREHIGNWIKYARFEEDNREHERARSVFERALEVDHRSGELWLRYAEFEMRNEFVNHARNVLDRAVQLLPRVDFLWYRYAHMEETLGDLEKTRTVFERWTEWQPDDNVWLSYARLETRSGRLPEAKAVMERYVNAYPCARSFLRYAKWAEHEAKDAALAREIYESALAELEPEEINARVFRLFSSFEERQGEHERARLIYKHAVSLFGLGEEDDAAQRKRREEENVSEWEMEKRAELYKAYITFEKKHGNREAIEKVVLAKQRKEFVDRVTEDPRDYDAWFDYAKMEEEHGDPEAVRDVYERAISNLPPSQQKQHWRRYIYLWIYYALFEELNMKDLDRASKVYSACLSVIPHEQFSFAKIWINAAKLHVRRRDLPAARRTLGNAIGRCGKERIFVEYVALESALGEVDRCRALHERRLAVAPHDCRAWTAYADLEKSCGETDRCRALYELAVSRPVLDGPEALWKSYVDFEIDNGEGDKARALYERLLRRTGHVRVWISLARFEGTPLGRGPAACRDTFKKAYEEIRRRGATDGTSSSNHKEERVLLLDAWRTYEKSTGDQARLAEVDRMMPRRVKRKRMRADEAGGGWEEYFDYHFPDDEGAEGGNLKILEMAAKWKKKQQEAAASADTDDDDESDESDVEDSDSDGDSD